jgi:DNA topoisomerase-1
MAPAVYDETRVDVRARPPARPGRPVDYLLRARGATLRFRGYLADHEESREEGPATSKEAGEALREPAADGREDGGPLPPLERGEELERVKVDTEQRFTEPPSRFSEASLVKELERNGIGRPSTYAAILETLASRDYVERHEGRLRPTRLGFVVADLLIAKFPDLMDVSYTASMEEGLDGIEEGRESLLDVLTRFWRRLERELEAAGRRASSTAPGPAAAMEHSRNAEEAVPAREAEAALGACPRCASPLTRRQGRYGPFVGCSRYPACRHVQKKEATRVGLVCPACHQGEAVEREGPQGRRFYGCSRYPACRFTSHHRPVPESCPECGRPYLLVRDTKRDGRLVFCGNEACHYHRTA